MHWLGRSYVEVSGLFAAGLTGQRVDQTQDNPTLVSASW